MNRRRLLAAAGLGLVATTGRVGRGDRPGAGPDATGREGPPASTPVPADVALPLPESAFERGAARDAIPALVDPATAADWDGVILPVDDQFGRRTVTPRLADADPVVGVVVGGTGDDDPAARAYPLRVLVWHEVANDVVGGRPIVVSYCPLCGSGLVADRRVGTDGTDGGDAGDGGRTEPATFGVSGLLWRDNLVAYDAGTGSLWSQVLARAVRGPLTGTRLSLLPTTVTSWGAWRTAHPGTDVLLPPPASGTVAPVEVPRDYRLDPYAGYADNRAVGFGAGGYASRAPPPPVDDRLHPKAQVLGVARGSAARAYPYATVAVAGPVSDVVADLPLVVATAGDGLVAYDRRVAGRTRRVRAAGDGDAAFLRAAGSRWRARDGVAVDGPHAGRRLRPATRHTTQYWFSWHALYPETTVYGVDA